MAVGSRTDWSIADQYPQYLKAKGFDVSFSRTSETVLSYATTSVSLAGYSMTAFDPKATLVRPWGKTLRMC